MKVIVRINSSTKTGYELATIDANGADITVTPITRQHVERGQLLLDLPKNPANRGHLSVKKFTEQAVDGVLELEDHIERATSGHSAKTIPVTIGDIALYLNDKERELFESWITRAKLHKAYDMAKIAYDDAVAKLAELNSKEAE